MSQIMVACQQKHQAGLTLVLYNHVLHTHAKKGKNHARLLTTSYQSYYQLNVTPWSDNRDPPTSINWTSFTTFPPNQRPNEYLSCSGRNQHDFLIGWQLLVLSMAKKNHRCTWEDSYYNSATLHHADCNPYISYSQLCKCNYRNIYILMIHNSGNWQQTSMILLKANSASLDRNDRKAK